MELITKYQAIQEEQSTAMEAARRAANPFGGSWQDFQQSRERLISVFAGRGTGKTHNLALRAARSPFDCTIFAFNEMNMNELGRMIMDMLNESEIADVRNTRTEFRIRTVTGRVIFIENGTQIRGMRFTDEEVMFDEFDYAKFESIMRNYSMLFRDARHIVCVGSIRIDGPTSNYARDWFMNSDLKLCIDNPQHAPGQFLREYAAEFL